MLDDGIVLVALHHADMEEATIFLIGHRLERVLRRIAVILRPLHQRDGGRGKIRDDAPQPERLHLVIAVDHRNIDRLGIGQRQSPVEGAALEALELFEMKEAEIATGFGIEGPAMRLHRPPGFRIGGVVVQNDDFVIVVIQPGQRVQAFDHHLWRLVVGRQMDGDARRCLGNAQLHRPPVHPPQGGRQLDAFGEDHGAGQQHQR